MSTSGVRFGLVCKTCDVVETFRTKQERDAFAGEHRNCVTEQIRLVVA